MSLTHFAEETCSRIIHYNINAHRLYNAVDIYLKPM